MEKTDAMLAPITTAAAEEIEGGDNGCKGEGEGEDGDDGGEVERGMNLEEEGEGGR